MLARGLMSCQWVHLEVTVTLLSRPWAGRCGTGVDPLAEWQGEAPQPEPVQAVQLLVSPAHWLD